MFNISFSVNKTPFGLGYKICQLFFIIKPKTGYNSSMALTLPQAARKIVKLFKQNNFEIFLVGGAVRDYLMAKPITDWDFTTNATPEEMLKFLPDAYYNNNFGTIGISIEGEPKPFEITTFRKEARYTDSRHPDEIKWGETLEEDLERRDFTINAL